VTSSPPPLDDLVGDWISRADLAHLHSLRNQWGQAHVNGDLTSLSWLAIPPFTGGYHTGVLRVDGRVLLADRSQWSPWGVKRAAVADGLEVVSDVRMAFEANRVLWRVLVTNHGSDARDVKLDQELLAPIAHTEVGWGWLYDTPWNWGNYHDYYATERIRAEVGAEDPRQVQLIPHDHRVIRLGRPRLPGIQRDEDSDAMLLESTLPAHITADSTWHRADAVLCEVLDLALRSADGECTRIPGIHALTSAHSEVRLAPIGLDDGSTLSITVRIGLEGQTGVILTHGNHPDSLQLGLEAGVPWLAIGGERVGAVHPLSVGDHVIAVTVASTGAVLTVDGEESARTQPWWAGQRWLCRQDRDVAAISDSLSPARSAYAFSPAPRRLDIEGSRAVGSWSMHLAPGETAEVSFTLEIGTDERAVAERARWTARTFDSSFGEIADRWRALWRNAFTRDNPDHSGYLPTLDATDDGLARTYYLGVLLALYMRNTGVSPSIGPVFLTGGPRLGATTTFYWDLSEWARTAAMLEPVGIRAWILAALAQPYDKSHSFDTRNLLPVGNHYAANDHALFRIVQGYVGVTGDTELLDTLAGDRSVLDHLRRFAYRPRERHAGFGSGVLVDFGNDAWELLECVPNYRDAVVSFNAGYVGMLRSLAALLEQRDEIAEAQEARAESAALAAAVLEQYAGDGRWRISHPSGDDIIGHCLDFELIAADMTDDLTEDMRTEMVDFVEDHLIDGEWMRALSPDDPIAPFSDRPDHGAAGAFAAWPGATSYGLSCLGRSDLAADFLSRVHWSRSGALWGQAVEAIGDGHYRVAERGVSNRESSAGVAVTECVIAGLFGIHADFAGLAEPTGVSVNAYGSLRNIRALGFDLQPMLPGVEARPCALLSPDVAFAPGRTDANAT
jgi:hypothetical protein